MLNLLLNTLSRARGSLHYYYGTTFISAAKESASACSPTSQEIIQSYLVSLGYMAGLTFDLRLEAEVIARLSAWSLGIEHDHQSLFVARCCVGIADYAYRNHSFQNKIYISLLSWFSMTIDDRVTNMRVPLERFHERLLDGKPQLDPLLDHLALLLKDTTQFWDPVCSTAIICSFLEFVASTLIQDRDEMKAKRGAVESPSWPEYIRAKDGEPDAYAYMIFPRDMCPDVSVYIQAIPDICTFINYNNDVLSFYKEELAGETHNLVHARAQASGNSPLAELALVAEECLAATCRVRAILRGKGKYEEAWVAFERGYVTFHTAGKRYRLGEIGLGEDPAEITSSE
ncbi:isoprenoid synthase domain-containing protein [Mycena sanguinolenta]|nr:isoprenoid synthase domain-containing protein [Mycena sanguinolenta]